MAVSVAEIKALWLAHLIVLQILQQRRIEWRSRQAGGRGRRGEHHRKELGALLAATEAFQKAYYGRAKTSPQAKYTEARLAGRRALMENQHPMFDGFPGVGGNSGGKYAVVEIAAYLTQEVKLPNDQFLDVVYALARDQANPADVANPPARIRTALAGQRRRGRAKDRERWMPPAEEQISSLEDLENVESMAIAKVDWERGSQALELPEDQKLAVEARIEGLDVQGSDAAESLGLDADRLERTRRSLEPDRQWGRKLRKRFTAYNQSRNREKG